ncbi:MAG: ATP-binding protein [Elusimicrobiota bacterium]
MSFGRPSLGLRLALWYGAFFAVGVGLVLTISYALTARALRDRDRAAILGRLEEIESDYRNEGHGLSRISYVVRLCRANGETFMLNAPRDLKGFDEPSLRTAPCSAPGWSRLDSRTASASLALFTDSFPDWTRLQVGLADEDRRDILARIRNVVLLTMIPAFLFAGVAGYYLARRALRPLRALLAAVAAIEAGDLSARVQISTGSGDELDALSLLFNRMLDRISRLIAGMRESLDDIAHELRTPATRLRGAAEAALNAQPDSGADRAALAECLEESQRVCATLDTLMDLAEAEAGALRPRLQTIGLRVLLEESAELYRLDAEESGRSLDLDCAEGLRVRADPPRLRRVLANLLDNAVKYGGASGRIRLSALKENGKVSISVEDDGPGIVQEDLPRIFERLYRSERDRSKSGRGLGLSLVKALVETQGGTVAAENIAGHGARFIVRLALGE